MTHLEWLMVKESSRDAGISSEDVLTYSYCNEEALRVSEEALNTRSMLWGMSPLDPTLLYVCSPFVIPQ